MRIVYVTHQYPPNYNTGTELYAKRLALKTRGTFGYDVRIFTFEPTFAVGEGELVRREETVDAGVAVTRIGMWPGLLPNFALGTFYNVFVGKEFARYLQDIRPDVVHFFHTSFLGASVLEEAFIADVPSVVNLMDFWFICPTAQLLKTRTYAQCEGPTAFDCLECLSLGSDDYERLLAFTRGDGFTPVYEDAAYRDGIRWTNSGPYNQMAALAGRLPALREILNRVDRIVAPSEALRQIFGDFGYDTNRIQVSRYGVDPMPPYTFDRRESKTLRVGFIGSINRPKGLHVLIEAFRGVEGDLRLDIHGDPGLFPTYAEECFLEARHDPRIRARGAMKPEHLATALREIDVLVVPSLWHENTPFVVLEGMAAGVPVVGSAVRGVSETIEDGRNGRLFPPGEMEALRAILSELAADRDQVRRLTGHFGEVRTLLANAREFAEMYETLVNRSRSNREPMGVEFADDPTDRSGAAHDR